MPLPLLGVPNTQADSSQANVLDKGPQPCQMTLGKTARDGGLPCRLSVHSSWLSHPHPDIRNILFFQSPFQLQLHFLFPELTFVVSLIEWKCPNSREVKTESTGCAVISGPPFSEAAFVCVQVLQQRGFYGHRINPKLLFFLKSHACRKFFS